MAPDAQLVRRLAELFREAGKAHHQAFSQTNGEDPEWPLWYADYLQDRIGAIAGRAFTRSELVYFLVRADKEHSQRAPRADWPAYYATLLVQLYT